MNRAAARSHPISADDKQSSRPNLSPFLFELEASQTRMAGTSPTIRTVNNFGCGSAGRVPVVNVTRGMPHRVPAVIDARLALAVGGIGGPDAERALEAADDAADRAADHRPDRPGGVASDISAVGDAVGNALRLRRERASERCGNGGR
jgi:hypothetical protein